MTTHLEQLFLYGEIETDAPLPEPLMTLIAYADLTAGSAIIFAAVILLSLLIACWGTLSFLISTSAKKFVLSPIQIVISLLSCYLLELFRLLSSCDDRHTALSSLKERLTRLVTDSRPYRLSSTIFDWYFPWNRPLATCCRLFGTYVCGLTVCTSLVIPATRYLSGLVDGWYSEMQSLYCPGAISKYYLDQRLCRRGLATAYYCFGEKAGLRLQTLTMSDWQLLNRLLSDDGEIDHYHAIIIVASAVLFVIVGTVSCTLVPEAAAFQCLKSFLLRQGPYPGRRSLTQTEIDLWDMINQYEGDLMESKAQLAEKSKLLAATTVQLSASKQRQEDGWALVEKLTASRNEAVEAQCCEQSNNRRLRQQLVKVGGQLQVAEGRLQSERQELARARQEVAEERQHLASVRQEFAEHQCLADDWDHLAQERQRFDEVREKPATERQQLAEERQRLIDEHERNASQHQELADQQHRLASDNKQLIAQCNKLSAALATTRQERDAAMMQVDAAINQVMSQQQDIESTDHTASTTPMQAHESLSQAEESEAAPRQSMSDIKNACDQALAQERAATEEARQRASALELEVNNFRTKIGLAMRDAQRSHEQAVASQRTIEVLKRRLAKYRQFKHGGLQEIPKRQVGSLGSISTALAEKEVTVANQLAQINDLTRQLEQAKQGIPYPVATDEAAQENFKKLRAALDKERRERTEDNVRWGSKTRELEAANQKLRISLSNAEAKSPRRPGGRRPVVP